MLIRSNGLTSTQNLIARTLSSSFLLSADVTHAYNPNFPASYLPGLSPALNTGIALKLDANGHYTSDAVTVALLRLIGERGGGPLQSESTTYQSHQSS